MCTAVKHSYINHGRSLLKCENRSGRTWWLLCAKRSDYSWSLPDASTRWLSADRTWPALCSLVPSLSSRLVLLISLLARLILRQGQGQGPGQEPSHAAEAYDSSWPTQTQDGMEMCKRFVLGRCRSGSCRFAHVCPIPDRWKDLLLASPCLEAQGYSALTICAAVSACTALPACPSPAPQLRALSVYSSSVHSYSGSESPSFCGAPSLPLPCADVAAVPTVSAACGPTRFSGYLCRCQRACFRRSGIPEPPEV